MTTAQALPPVLHWERSSRRHGLWTEDNMTRIASIGLSPPRTLCRSTRTIYSWYIDWPRLEAAKGQATSLRDAKKQVAKTLEQFRFSTT